MVKIGLLVPYEEMLVIARRVAEEQDIDIAYMKVIDTVNTVNEARAAVEAGVHIIVARGYQARLIREYTNIPLVELRFHAQEIGLLLKRAKAIVKKERPKVGLLVFENMLCDMSHMEELFGVELFIEYMKKMEDTVPLLYKLSDKKPDIIIGGDNTCEEAQKMGYPTLFYESTEESIAEGLQTAERMAYAAEAEKQNEAQFETVLDTSFNGIIKINAEGNIIVINKLVENLIGKNAEDVIGLPIEKVIPEFDREMIDRVLLGTRETYSTSVNLRHQAWVLLVAPIQYDERITGAILSVQKVTEGVRREQNDQKNMFLYGFAAQTTFQNIHTENDLMGHALELAKAYALSESPVVIYGEEGVECYPVAEAIHNNSRRKSGPYVTVNVEGMDERWQMEVLFGGGSEHAGEQVRRTGALAKANNGTIFIKGIEYLGPGTQHEICRTVFEQAAMRAEAQPPANLNVRLIGFSKMNLQHMMNTGKLGQSFFYHVQGLTVEIPSLQQRSEDLMYYFDLFFKESCKKYNKYFVLTAGARQKISQLVWKGNLLQLQAFCERLILVSEKRSIDEVQIQKLYSELYPYISESGGEGRVVVYKSQEAMELSNLLEKHHGSRQLVAEELGISTTTLWRRMKKYGIEMNFKLGKEN